MRDFQSRIYQIHWFGIANTLHIAPQEHTTIISFPTPSEQYSAKPEQHHLSCLPLSSPLYVSAFLVYAFLFNEKIFARKPCVDAAGPATTGCGGDLLCWPLNADMADDGCGHIFQMKMHIAWPTLSISNPNEDVAICSTLLYIAERYFALSSLHECLVIREALCTCNTIHFVVHDRPTVSSVRDGSLAAEYYYECAPHFTLRYYANGLLIRHAISTAVSRAQRTFRWENNATNVTTRIYVIMLHDSERPMLHF